VTQVLWQSALRWLTDLGILAEQTEVWTTSEPKLGASWLAYLVLAPIAVIDEWRSTFPE
jgi:hypothetical protein